MRRDQLEHLIRAAGAISGSRRLVAIGSQAILGQFPDGAPARATLSMEADLLPIDAPEMSDMLTGSLGELSPFHDREFCAAVAGAGLVQPQRLLESLERLASVPLESEATQRIARWIASDCATPIPSPGSFP